MIRILTFYPSLPDPEDQKAPDTGSGFAKLTKHIPSGSFLGLLDPDPATKINADPDPKHCIQASIFQIKTYKFFKHFSMTYTIKQQY